MRQVKKGAVNSGTSVDGEKENIFKNWGENGRKAQLSRLKPTCNI